jgi:hypothetical protein
MAATCVILTLIHKQHRFENYKEIEDYCHEQIESVVQRSLSPTTEYVHLFSLRRSIIALHSAAADRYMDDDMKHDTIIGPEGYF